MHLLLDLDTTLIDTKRYSQTMYTLLQTELGFSDQKMTEFREAYYATLEDGSDFELDRFIDHVLDHHPETTLSRKDAVRAAALAKAADPELLESIVFEDVTRNLPRLSNEFHLGVFSQGFEKFQRLKLEKSGLFRFFEQEHVYISRRKTAPEFLAQLPAGATIVDDKPEVVEAIMTQPHLHGVLIDREGTASGYNNGHTGAKTSGPTNANTSTGSNQPYQIISSFDELG